MPGVGDHRSTSFPSYRHTIAAMVRHVGERFGDQDLAILDDRRLSYRDADLRSAELAKGLLATGVGKGARLGLLAPNGPDWIIGWLAGARIGAVVVMCNTYHRPRELGWVLRHADVQVLLSIDQYLGNDFAERLESAAPDLGEQTAGRIAVTSHPYLRSVYLWGDPDRSWCRSVDELVDRGVSVSDELLRAVEDEVSPADPATVVYSSGSTADPKGVIHDQGTLVRHPCNLAQFRDVHPGDVQYTPMPLFWVGGLSWTLLSSMHVGAAVVFQDRFEPGSCLDLLERERVTHVVGWPHMGKALVEHPSFAERDLSSVRGGSVDALLPPELRVGDPELRANSLGMTETCGPHSLELIGSALPPEKKGSFGRSVPGVEHRIVDAFTGDEVPTGELGEIQVRGYSLLSGMVKRERSEVFTPDGWYATGDAGHLDADGHLYFKGRMGDQIKSSGMNVAPREVELVIEEEPEVMHAFVMAVPHVDRIEDVAAAVVLRPEHRIDAEELTARLKQQLSSYKVPRHILTFASPDDLPWLESGKIDRRAIKRLLQEEFG